MNTFFSPSRTGFKLSRTRGTFGSEEMKPHAKPRKPKIFAAFCCQKSEDKKVFSLQARDLWHCALVPNGKSGPVIKSCDYKRQRRDLSVFESSCQLPTRLPQTIRLHTVPFRCTPSKKALNTNFSGNRTQVYRFSSKRSIQAMTDRLK